MNKRTQGFTIVELSIAIAFIAVLLMAILSLTITAGRMYVKADTNKAINQAGRDIADIIRRDLLSASMSTIKPVVTQDAGDAAAPLISGRLCIGAVVYVWNTAALLNSTDSAANEIKIVNAADKPIKLVRITHPTSAFYCTPDGSGRYTTKITDPSTELLDGDGLDYAIHSMIFTPLAKTGNKGLYSIAYTLGTNQPYTTERSSDGYIQCKPNDSVLANFDYCSVSEFDTIARIGGVK